MSIETEFQSTIQNVQNAYNKLDNLGATIPQNKTIENISECLEEIYTNLPKTSFQTGTEVTLENCLKGKLDFEEDNGKKVVGIGQSEQYSTKGYQLLDLKNGSYSSNNITANVNNGTITMSGTASANTFIAIPCNTNYNIAVGSTITISANNSTTADVRIRIDNSGTLDTSLDTINKANTINVSTALYGNQIYLRVQNGTTLNNFTFKPMLEKGSTAHDWEPYVGNTQSPSPSYPQLVKIARGKNICNLSIVGQVPSVSNGQLVASPNGACTDYIDIDNTEHYMLSFGGLAYMYVFLYGADKTYLGYQQYTSGSYDISTIANYNQAKYIRVRTDNINVSTNVQLEERKCSYSILAF